MSWSVLERYAPRLIAWGLGLALAYGALEQGGFYANQFQKMSILLVLVVIGRALMWRRSVPRSLAIACAGLGLLAVWALARASIEGSWLDGGPIAGASASLAVAVLGVTALEREDRELLVHLVLIVGVLVSLSTWAGVAWHYEPWAIPSQSLWRGASTITYANATAAYLFAPMLLAVERFIRTRRLAYLVVLLVLTVGWTATLSRAAGLSLLVAAVFSAARLRDRRVVLSLWPLVPAVAVAAIGLIPSLSEGADAEPLLAVLSLLGGIGLVVVLARARMSIAVAVVGLVTIGALAPAAASGVLGDTVAKIQQTRVEGRSSDRADLNAVTWDQFVQRPEIGVGPGKIDFNYVNHAGQSVRAEFTHNEYLQVATELGLPGLVMVLVAITALGALSFRAPDPRALTVVGGQVVLTSFVLHAGLDFLWHVPVVGLTTVVSSLILVTQSGYFRPLPFSTT